MAGIIIPTDRTTKQQPRGYCLNPECLESSDQERFEFDVDHDRFACPKCGANSSPMAGLLVLTHLLMRDHKGPLIGAGGLKYRVACDDTRAYLATVTNQEAASGDVTAVNCPGCLIRHAEMKLPTVAGMSLSAQHNN
jgi:hypothetical protein